MVVAVQLLLLLLVAGVCASASEETEPGIYNGAAEGGMVAMGCIAFMFIGGCVTRRQFASKLRSQERDGTDYWRRVRIQEAE